MLWWEEEEGEMEELVEDRVAEDRLTGESFSGLSPAVTVVVVEEVLLERWFARLLLAVLWSSAAILFLFASDRENSS